MSTNLPEVRLSRLLSEWLCWKHVEKLSRCPSMEAQTHHPLPLSPTEYGICPSANASPSLAWALSKSSPEWSGRRKVEWKKNYSRGSLNGRPGCCALDSHPALWPGQRPALLGNEKSLWQPRERKKVVEKWKHRCLIIMKTNKELFQKHFFEMCQPIRVFLFTRNKCSERGWTSLKAKCWYPYKLSIVWHTYWLFNV